MSSKLPVIKGVGVDLGTTFSSIAIKLNEKEHAFVIDSFNGEKYIPSKICIKGNKPKVWQPLVDCDGDCPIIYDVKRHIGRYYSDIKHSITNADYPYIIQSSEKDQIAYNVGGDYYSPTELTTVILKMINRRIQEWVDKGIHDYDRLVVLTVPCYFSIKQKDETLKAAKKAGIKRVCLLPEPVAAVLSYVEECGQTLITEMKKMQDQYKAQNAFCINSEDAKESKEKSLDMKLLVVDIGGGTTDFSIHTLKAYNSHNHTKKVRWDIKNDSIHGIRYFGGQDFTNNINTIIKTEIYEQHSDIINDLSDVNKSRLDAQIRNASDRVKKHLSKHEKFQFVLKTDWFKHSMCLARVQLIKSMSKEMNNFENVLRKCTDNKLLHRVLLVGGSSEIPAIRECIQAVLPQCTLLTLDNPRDATAKGAAILSYYQYNNDDKYRFQHISAFNIGLGIQLELTSGHVNRDYFWPIIHAGDSIPFRAVYHDLYNSDSLKVSQDLSVKILEGNEMRASANEVLGWLDLPADRNYKPKEFRMTIECSASIDGLFTIKAYKCSKKRRRQDNTTGCVFHTFNIISSVCERETDIKQRIKNREKQMDEKYKLELLTDKLSFYCAKLDEYNIKNAGFPDICDHFLTVEQIQRNTKKVQKVIVKWIKSQYQERANHQQDARKRSDILNMLKSKLSCDEWMDQWDMTGLDDESRQGETIAINSHLPFQKKQKFCDDSGFANQQFLTQIL